MYLLKLQKNIKEHTERFEASSSTYMSPSTALCTRLDSTPSFSKCNYRNVYI